ncbi:MAG: hypothetical protein P8183_05400 [Anaerolineae bacterium]
MFETKTTWEDSGHDCNHCGGEVLQRTEGMPDGGTAVSLQCRECGCRWSLAGDWLRVGNGRSCRTAYREDNGEPGQLARRSLTILGVVVLLVIARMGGIGALRYLVPLAILGAVAWTIHKVGQEFHLW